MSALENYFGIKMKIFQSSFLRNYFRKKRNKYFVRSCGATVVTSTKSKSHSYSQIHLQSQTSQLSEFALW